VPQFTEAIAWYEAGYMPLPLKIDGSKAPAVKTWTDYQQQRPPLDEVLKLFRIDSDGIGLLCGAVSGGLEMLEFEGRAVREGHNAKIEDAFRAYNLSELYYRIIEGYAESTPSGGLHFYYRVDGNSRRNSKLARRPATEAELAENPDEKYKVLIETRGEGGFTVIAPSGGRSHRSGQGWWVVAGSLKTIPVITADERDAIHAVCNTLDQMPLVQGPPPAAKGGLIDVSDRPGDMFNAQASWEEILGPHGWTLRKHYGGNLYGWAKPGKRGPGVSATTGRSSEDRLFVFSTTTDFEAEHPYTKFSAYATLNHGGDFSAAARELRKRGYGGHSEAVGKPQTPAEDLARILRSVATIDPWFASAQLGWAAQQIRTHHQQVPNVWEGLRRAARQKGLPDERIEEVLGVH
jgi:putative DNA primase/helicase